MATQGKHSLDQRGKIESEKKVQTGGTSSTGHSFTWTGRGGKDPPYYYEERDSRLQQIALKGGIRENMLNNPQGFIKAPRGGQTHENLVNVFWGIEVANTSNT